MNRKRRVALIVLVVLAVVILAATIAMARPGGGGSFSGGGGGGGSRGGGGSSGGGGGDGLFGFIIGVFFELLPWPVKLLVVAIFIGAFIFKAVRGKSQGEDWSTAADQAQYQQQQWTPPVAARPAAADVRTRLAAVRQFDPDFSLVLFEDFLYALYAETRYALGRGQIALLSAYLSPDVLARMQSMRPTPTRAVIIGAMRYVDAGGLDAASSEVRLDVELESNVSIFDGNAETSLYVVERWTLARKHTARSRKPARARVLDCPGCGAPLTAVIAGTCTHCKRVVATGELDWIVRDAQVLRQETRPPLLTSDVQEEGTDLPTIVAPDAQQRFVELQQRDPAFTWHAFQQRLGLVFGEFQVAWSARDLAKMRAYLSDNLFQMQSYWVNAYLSQGLRNMNDNARIEGIELARVESDAFYDAVTVRVRAAGLDYTITDRDGRVVSGSKSRERRYTEYWTLIRGAARKGPSRTDNACPNCGAPLVVNMAGVCNYCKAKVTSGEFDWVLSRIEQDEVYAG